MAETPLDRSHAAMETAPDDDALRLRFFDALAGAELFLLLDAEADGEAIVPRTFPLDGTAYVLAFDTVYVADKLDIDVASVSGRKWKILVANVAILLQLNK
jgi:hypothetical protein